MPALGSASSTIAVRRRPLALRLRPQAGRHLRTLDALTSATLLSFGYDGAGRLVTVTDDKDRTTTIARDAAGTPTKIIAPYGQDDELEPDATATSRRSPTPAGGTMR